ncbi:MAG TPA: FAD-binding oxidoreductase [Streptosporangiaceae bacterium]|jgi:FAD/FMN-containing dehydrogenase
MTQIAENHMQSLRSRVTGTVAGPGSADYRDAVNIWNGAIDRHPSLVVRCASSADVAQALGFAQERGLEVSVRGGGHNFAGFAVTEGGLMIDLTPLKSVQVDPGARTVTAGGGVTWAELDAAGQQHALAVPGGFISHTGIGGLTLGGGMGWLTRLGGLSCDNLTGAEVVTADGRILRASEEEHPDLFWALRGGGGNFGVVTEFKYRMHQVGPVVNLAIFFAGMGQGAALLRYARGLFNKLPRDLTMFVAGLNFPPEPFVPAEQQGQPGWALVVVGYGSAQAHERAVAPVRAAVSPLFELVTPIPYVNLQQMFDGSAPWGIMGYERGIFLEELTDGAIDTIVGNQPHKQAALTFTPIFCLGGAFADTPEDATAFGGSRSMRYVVNMAAISASKDEYEHDRQWARDCWSALVPHAGGVASYVNFMSEYEEDRVKASYGPAKYQRLAQLKREYDPTNVFHLNANIRPA